MKRILPNVIVLGNQKSGTTAIAALIAHFSGFTKTLDIPEFWNVEQSIYAGKITFESFVKENPHRFEVQLLKEPCLTFMSENLLRTFPLSKYIFVSRHPADNIRSMLDRWKIPGNLKNARIGEDFHKAWKNVFYGTLMNLEDDENYIVRLARRWVVASEAYLNNRDKMILARYEDFMKDKSGFIKFLTEKIGIEKKNEINEILDKQYQPKGTTRGKPWVECFGEENLSIINDICGPYLSEFSYTAY